MVRFSSRWGRSGSALVLAALLAGAGLIGCNRQQDKADKTEAVAAAAAKDARPAVDPSWVRSFADATRKDPVNEWDPPTTTLTGKSVGKLFTEVQKQWDASKLVDESGHRLSHQAV